MKKIFITSLNVLVFILVISASPMSLASKLIIGQGSTVFFGSSSIQSTSLEVDNSGDLNWGSGQHQLLNFINRGAAVSNAQSSSIQVLQDWQNDGSFIPGTGTVEFLDSMPVSRLTGDTGFYSLVVASTVEKTIFLNHSSTQSIENHLTFTGVAGNLLKIRSSSEPNPAFLDLAQAATQTIDYVDVSYNQSINQVIAPGVPHAFNSLRGSNVRGWFLEFSAVPIPMLNPLSLFILLMLIALVTRKHLINRSQKLL